MLETLSLGVFTSCDGTFGIHPEVAQELGIRTTRLRCPRPYYRRADVLESYRCICAKHDLSVNAMVVKFAGENFSSVQSAANTVGLTPLHSRRIREAELRELITLCQVEKLGDIVLHLGQLGERDGFWHDLVSRVRDAAIELEKSSQRLLLESGQEAPELLAEFVGDVGAKNLGVNFDTGNWILYDSADPVAAFELLRPIIGGVDFKDALHATDEGELGKEVPFGCGVVPLKDFAAELRREEWKHSVMIERRTGTDMDVQIGDIGAAREFVQ